MGVCSCSNIIEQSPNYIPYNKSVTLQLSKYHQSYYQSIFIKDKRFVNFFKRILDSQKIQIKELHNHFQEAITKSIQKRKQLIEAINKKQENKQSISKQIFDKNQSINYLSKIQDIQNLIKNSKVDQSFQIIDYSKFYFNSTVNLKTKSNLQLISVIPKDYLLASCSYINQLINLIFVNSYYKQKGLVYIGLHPQDHFNQKKRLVKIGAAVTNQQLRRWSIQNNLTYQFKTKISQIPIISNIYNNHSGFGLNSTNICDTIYQIQFINYKGQVQTINKKQSPQLMRAASCSMGLIGIIIYLTLQMQELKYVKLQSKFELMQIAIPNPGNVSIQLNYMKNLEEFEKNCQMDYIQWIHYSRSDSQIYINMWKTQKEISKVQTPPRYPDWKLKNFQIYSSEAFNLIEERLKLLFYFIFSKLAILQICYNNKQYVTCTLDAINLQYGQKNFNVQQFYFYINLPYSNKLKNFQFDIVRKSWWAVIQTLQKKIQNRIETIVQMKLLGNSKCFLVPECGFDATCMIKITKKNYSTEMERGLWIKLIQQIYNRLRLINYTRDDGLKFNIDLRFQLTRQNMENDFIKKHIQKDTKFQANIKQFSNCYKKICDSKNWILQQVQKKFSTQFTKSLIQKK